MHAAFGLHAGTEGRSRAFKLLVGNQALDQDLAQGIAVERAEFLEVFVELVIVVIGFALIAQMGKAPVNPLAICGWSDITPAGKKLMRPKKCWIRAGKAISLSDAPAELKRKERLAWFESEAMSRVYAMRDDLCAEHPGRF